MAYITKKNMKRTKGYIREAKELLKEKKYEYAALRSRHALEDITKMLMICHSRQYGGKSFDEVIIHEDLKSTIFTLFHLKAISYDDRMLLDYIRKAGNSAAHPGNSDAPIDLTKSNQQKIFKVYFKRFSKFTKRNLKIIKIDQEHLKAKLFKKALKKKKKK